MKKALIFIFFNLAVLIAFAQNPELKTYKLPLVLEDGYGLNINYQGLTIEGNDLRDHPLSKIFAGAKGAPLELKNVKIGLIDLNTYQLVYQSYLSGIVPEEMYQELQLAFKWQPDTMILSKNSIKCYVYVAVGEDNDGNLMAIIDTDNNHDFSNNSIFKVENLTLADMLNKSKQGDILEKAKKVSFERMVNGKVSNEYIYVSIFTINGRLAYTIPQHFKVYLSQASGKEFEFNVEVSSQDNSDLVLKVDEQERGYELFEKGDLISINHKVYKYIGVDIFNRYLNLEEVSNEDMAYSSQVGYKAIPFSGKDFKTGEEITLEKYKGKFLFIDFWGSWCGPCLQQLPHLKRTYSKMDKNKFAILGIARDNPKALENILNKEAIQWPQILADSENKILEAYNITAYPTSLLINPSGKIIAKDLSGEELEKTFATLEEE